MMTPMVKFASALEQMSRDFRAIAATERRWDRDMLRDHAETLGRIAFDLFLEDEPENGEML